MRRRVVLLTVCYVGLAAELGLHDVSFSFSAHRGCGPNETLNDCVFECPPEKTCDTRKLYLLCLTGDNSCEQKCVCKEGYFRKTEDGECISDEDCGPACEENKEYTDCKNPCMDESCAAMGSLKPNCTDPCEPGCACKEGFFRLYPGWPCFSRCSCHALRNTPECRIYSN